MRVLFRASPSKRRGPSRHPRLERCHLSSRGACRTAQASPAFTRALPRDRRLPAVRAQRPSRRECAASHRARHTTWREAVARTPSRFARVVTGPPPVTYPRIPRSARLSSGLLRMTKARNPRDGLLKAITPFPRGAQRSSPNDSRKGSKLRALTALRQSWVNDSRDQRSLGGAQSRRRVSAVRRRRAAKQPHKTGGCLPLLAASAGVATALQASSNTYPKGLTPR